MKKKRIMAAMAVLTMTLVAGAQTNDGYFVGKNYVSYCDSLMSGADARRSSTSDTAMPKTRATSTRTAAYCRSSTPPHSP